MKILISILLSLVSTTVLSADGKADKSAREKIDEVFEELNTEEKPLNYYLYKAMDLDDIEGPSMEDRKYLSFKAIQAIRKFSTKKSYDKRTIGMILRNLVESLSIEHLLLNEIDLIFSVFTEFEHAQYTIADKIKMLKEAEQLPTGLVEKLTNLVFKNLLVSRKIDDSDIHLILPSILELGKKHGVSIAKILVKNKNTILANFKKFPSYQFDNLLDSIAIDELQPELLTLFLEIGVHKSFLGGNSFKQFLSKALQSGAYRFQLAKIIVNHFSAKKEMSLGFSETEIINFALPVMLHSMKYNSLSIEDIINFNAICAHENIYKSDLMISLQSVIYYKMTTVSSDNDNGDIMSLAYYIVENQETFREVFDVSKVKYAETKVENALKRTQLMIAAAKSLEAKDKTHRQDLSFFSSDELKWILAKELGVNLFRSTDTGSSRKTTERSFSPAFGFGLVFNSNGRFGPGFGFGLKSEKKEVTRHTPGSRPTDDEERSFLENLLNESRKKKIGARYFPYKITLNVENHGSVFKTGFADWEVDKRYESAQVGHKSHKALIETLKEKPMLKSNTAYKQYLKGFITHAILKDLADALAKKGHYLSFSPFIGYWDKIFIEGNEDTDSYVIFERLEYEKACLTMISLLDQIDSGASFDKIIKVDLEKSKDEMIWNHYLTDEHRQQYRSLFAKKSSLFQKKYSYEVFLNSVKK